MRGINPSTITLSNNLKKLMHTDIYSTCSTDVGILPSVKIFCDLARKLCRRVVTDTDNGRKVSGEAIHHKSGVAYLRRDLPQHVRNVRVDYYRLPDGHHRDEDTSGSETSDSGVKSLGHIALAWYALRRSNMLEDLQKNELKVRRDWILLPPALDPPGLRLKGGSSRSEDSRAGSYLP